MIPGNQGAPAPEQAPEGAAPQGGMEEVVGTIGGAMQQMAQGFKNPEAQKMMQQAMQAFAEAVKVEMGAGKQEAPQAVPTENQGTGATTPMPV